jgi:hypothetical protein
MTRHTLEKKFPAARSEMNGLGRFAVVSRVRLSVAFPANPKIETTIYEVADGPSIPARVYASASSALSLAGILNCSPAKKHRGWALREKSSRPVRCRNGSSPAVAACRFPAVPL